MRYNIALLRGDGIGPEIVDSAVRVLERIAEKFGHTFVFTPYLIGGAAIDATGVPLPQETIDVGHTARRPAPRKGPAGYPFRHGAVHQPAPRQALPRPQG